jgi:hypothetical protein
VELIDHHTVRMVNASQLLPARRAHAYNDFGSPTGVNKLETGAGAGQRRGVTFSGPVPPRSARPLDDAAPCGHSVHGCGFDSTTDADLTSLLLPADSIKLIDASGTGPSGVGRRLYCRSNTNAMSAPPVLNHQLVAQLALDGTCTAWVCAQDGLSGHRPARVDMMRISSVRWTRKTF